MLPLILEGIGFRAGGQDLLAGVDLAIAAGPPTLFLGPNGAGKSLLLRLCHGLLTPTAGAVRWTGIDAERARRRQAMVFQTPVMLRRAAAANVAYGLKLRGLARAERAARTAEALALTGLAELAKRPARLLSGGEQQRLALARAWALRPEVLFLDEPTASLDPAATGQVEAIVRGIAAAGVKIVMSTHDLGQARRLAGEIVFLCRGRVAERAAAGAFFAGPRCAEARAFLEGRLTW
ncbi:MAG: ATP-binding cassette domain-containing protein [Proteobacteria bacterium]|nr:ATP-binding cassette domain-containing protein [Pseudomonadota bacterium]